MRSALFIVTSFLQVAIPCIAQIPPVLPPVNYPLVDDFRYADEQAAREAWKPMEGTAPVSVIKADGGNVLKMPCNFKGTKIERASWDRPIALDLAACQGIQFRLFCPDVSPVAHFTMYFESGAGWYAAGFSGGAKPGWNTITIDRSETTIEGSPSGWGTIKTIRISAWRGKDVDTELYISGLGLLGADAPIVIVRGESVVGLSPDEAKAVDRFAEEMAVCLKDLGLAYCVMSERDVTAERLKAKKVVILPHNPGMPDPVVDQLARFLRGGGKMICFYSLPAGLHPVVGIDGGRHVKESRSGSFASMRVSAEVLRGAPSLVTQRSWNISEALPVEGRSRVAARWHDDKGTPTDHAAIVVSDNCIQMTHVMLSDDLASKHRLLLAMVGHFVPDLWRQVARQRIDKVGRIGPYATFDEAQREMRRMASGDARVLGALDRIAALRTEADGLCSSGKYQEAIALVAGTGDLLLDAYCRAQQPAKGEHRAFWCHSAFGVSGMDWDAAIRILSDNGFTAIIPNMLWGGTAYYNSAVLPVAQEIGEKGDQITACLAACRKYGLQCHIWKVNWNMSGRASQEFVEKMKREGRTQVRFDGKPNDQWLCPSHPDNQKLEIDSMVEVAAKYDVDGIHFDYIRYPDERHCYCAGCRQRFEKTIGTKVADWPTDVRRNEDLKEKWREFRRGNITAVVAAVSEAARKANPKVKVSAAVFSNWPVDRDAIGQDWKLWCDRGYLDFVCPMDYTESNTGFENSIRLQQTWAGKVPCYPGIGMSVWTPSDDIVKLIDQISVTRRLGTGGFTIFNYGVPEAAKIVPLCGQGITRRESH